MCVTPNGVENLLFFEAKGEVSEYDMFCSVKDLISRFKAQVNHFQIMGKKAKT